MTAIVIKRTKKNLGAIFIWDRKLVVEIFSLKINSR